MDNQKNPYSSDANYDTIGQRYSERRKPDYRIQKAINNALGSSNTVLNVGAGTGSYEPSKREVTAIEPSKKMIQQRRHSETQAIQGCAENLPFANNSFDASMAILTLHHWTNQKKGLDEMRRVTTGPIVLLTYDPAFRDFWLLDYFPQLIDLDEAQMPPIQTLADWMGDIEILPVPIPHDCHDGFLSAHWKKPSAYLDPSVREAMSPFWAIDDLSTGLERLKNDLDNRAWHRRYANLEPLNEKDCGYRLIVNQG